MDVDLCKDKQVLAGVASKRLGADCLRLTLCPAPYVPLATELLKALILGGAVPLSRIVFSSAMIGKPSSAPAGMNVVERSLIR